MVALQRWIVTTAGDRPIGDITTDLADAEFTVAQTLSEVGIVIGTGEESLAQQLREIPGVGDVSPESNIDIGPPDSRDTW